MKEKPEVSKNLMLCFILTSLIFIIMCIILLLQVVKDRQMINEILNTNYEICIHVGEEEVCYRQKIDDYLKNYD